jgi:hypothetical protein
MIEQKYLVLVIGVLLIVIVLFLYVNWCLKLDISQLKCLINSSVVDCSSIPKCSI